MARAVGIDLGTTFSAVAVVDAAGTPVIVRTAEGRSTTPSVVRFDTSAGSDLPVVGEAALATAASRHEDTVQYVKRFMGDPTWRFDSATDEQYRAEEVSALILRALVREAEATLGEPITDVVITVPAYFDDSRRTATMQAGTIAGLTVLHVLNEPTAAALSFGVSTDNDGIVLVYDLGGGTFDVTILGIEDQRFSVLATDGDRNLGGFDWDNAIMNHVVSELASTHGLVDVLDDLDAVAVLRQEAERAKRDLSTAEETTITLPVAGASYTVGLTRERFEQSTRPLLRRTQELVEDTLDEAGLGWGDIDTIVLVGGSTRMPAVRELITRLTGRAPAEGVDPDEAVALGAAIRAAQAGEPRAGTPTLDAVTVTDVTSHALGTLALDDDENVRNFVVIAKNEPVPAVGWQYMSTMRPSDRLTVSVTQGDDPDPDFVTEIGRGELALDEEWPAGTEFQIVYRYDVDQLVHVEVYRLPEDALAGSFGIDRVANLTTVEVERATAKLDALAPAAAPLPPAPSLPLPTLGMPLPTLSAPLHAPQQQPSTHPTR